MGKLEFGARKIKWKNGEYYFADEPEPSSYPPIIDFNGKDISKEIWEAKDQSYSKYAGRKYIHLICSNCGVEHYGKLRIAKQKGWLKIGKTKIGEGDYYKESRALCPNCVDCEVVR
jgi:hypothetical protein